MFFPAGPDPPTITGYTAGTLLPVGAAFSITCSSCGANPAPTVTWELASAALGSSSTQEANSCTVLDYEITSVTQADHDKTFDCKVDNTVGSPVTESITLQVQCEFYPL